jgi:cytochrome c553
VICVSYSGSRAKGIAMTRRATRIVTGLLCLAVAAALTVSCGIFTPVLVGDAAAGQLIFELTCQRCHAVVDLVPFSDLVVNDLGAINPKMEGIFLSDQQVADIRAFLDAQLGGTPRVIRGD